MLKKLIAITMAGVLMLSLAGCGSDDTAASGTTTQSDSKAADSSEAASADKEISIIFSNVTSQSGKDAGEKFKEVAEAESNGSITIDLFPDNQLGDDRVVIETTQFGDIGIGASSTSPLATMYADFYIFDAPYLFLSSQEAYDALDGEVGQKILDGLEEIGLKGLCFWENGFRNFTNNEIAVSKPADVEGMKIRTMENQVHIAAWKAFGANPTPMAFTELFTALQQGTVDGQENPLGIIDANRLQEVQKYVSMTQHVYTPYVVVMNLDLYNSLSDNQKAAIEKAAKESTAYQREQSQKYEKEIMTRLVDGGTVVTELTDDEKAAFQQIVIDANVYDMVRDVMDHPEYIDEVLK